MPRALQPNRSLATVYPSVAATWHPTANQPLTPETVFPKMGKRAVWRCAGGHEWDEVISTRTAMPAWKKGDVAACRVCVGYHSIVTFDCGHTAEVKTEFSNPDLGCPACRHAAYQSRRAGYADRAAAAKLTRAEDRNQARELLSEIDVGDIPAPLLGDWQAQALRDLTFAVSRERHHDEPGLTEVTLEAIRANTRILLPTAADLEFAVRTRQPVQVLRRAYWPRGWQHYLDPSTADVSASLADEGTIADLRLCLRTAVTEEKSGGHNDRLNVAGLTRWMTETVATWAYGQVAERPSRWSVYRELSIPVTTPGKTGRFGRLDITVLRLGAPDLVVEIDSAHNDRSVSKLTFARDAGAVAVWVRWHSGRVEAPEGVSVIDLVEATRGLASRA